MFENEEIHFYVGFFVIALLRQNSYTYNSHIVQFSGFCYSCAAIITINFRAVLSPLKNNPHSLGIASNFLFYTTAKNNHKYTFSIFYFLKLHNYIIYIILDKIIFHCMDISLFIHPSIDRHLGCFYHLDILNNAVTNMCLQVFAWICFHFLGYVLRSGISG